MNTDPKKESKLEMMVVSRGLGIGLLVAAFVVGVSIGKHSLSSAAIAHPAVDASLVTDAQFAPFWKAWKILNEKYVAASTTKTQDQVWGAIKGLAGAEGDPYTTFFPPVENQSFKEDISGNFEGVGMEIGLKDNLITVVAPIKNSPADRAGIQTGDKIIEINGTSTVDFSTDQAVKLIRGKKGTSVTLTIIREGQSEALKKTIVRDIIDIPTLDTEVKNGVFVLKLYGFTAQSPELFRNGLRKFIDSGTNKLVIDLRGNPGGYLDAAWDMASWFLPAGDIVVTEDFGANQEPNIYRSKGYNIFNKNLKLVILVNAGSASASEILAGALHEHGVGTLVGVKTFGKGSVQELIPITDDTSLKVTVARWLTPKGHNLSHDGLNPDVEVKMTQKDIDAKKDPQLDKAIEILNK